MDLAVDIGAVTMRVARWPRGATQGPGAAEVEVRSMSPEIAVGPLPWLGLGAAQRSAAGWSPAGTPARVLADLLGPVVAQAGAGDAITSVTLAAPDTWWDGRPAGAAARDAAREVLCGDLSLPAVRFVPRTVAAASAEPTAREGAAVERRLLVCDVGAHAVNVAVVVVRAGRVAVLDAQSSGGPGGQPAAARFEQALSSIVTRGQGGGPAASQDAARAVRVAVRDGHRRAAAILSRVRVDAKYADAPVYQLPLDPPVDILARDVVRAFDPITQTVRGVLGEVAQRGSLAAAPLDDVLLTGGLGGFPGTAAAVADALRPAGDSLRPAGGGPVRCRTVDPNAVVRGALLVGMAAVRFAELAGTVRLLVHRVRNGRLQRESLFLPGDGAGATAAGTGMPAQVEVGSGRHVVEVEARTGDDGFTTRCAAEGDPPPEGRYEVALWPAYSGAALAFRPVSGGEPTVTALPRLAPLTVRAREVSA
jgi:hypothetical protein